MYVKRLRLAGFKSFADPTILEFEAGVNVIVGPNGSGKSNIVDALQWVLGSQAPSSLRGASMEDVIFAGASGRPQLGMAEVELTLDNSSRILPLDLSEVTISRSTDRAGSSEYRINGAPCRLLDVSELLSDTGIGRSLHTVVGQGQLDAVLQARPEDRRVFIEEAAQIGKFRRRKDRSLRKIERVDENLLRLNDVVTELRRALRPLKRQANAASQYSGLVIEHRDLRQCLTAHEIRALQQQADDGELVTETSRVDLLAEELASVRARLESVTGLRKQSVEHAEATRAVAHRMARVADKLRGLGRLASERAATIGARLASETEEGYRERIRLLETERSRWAQSTEELVGAAERLRAVADAAHASLEAARSKEQRSDADLAGARAHETEAAKRLVRAEGAEAAGRATLGSVNARVHAALERREVRHRQLGEDALEVDRSQKEVETLESELDRVTELAAAAEAEVEQAREHADALRAKLGASSAGRAAAEARVAAFTEALHAVQDLPGAPDRLQPLLARASAERDVAGISEEEARVIVVAADQDSERRWTEVARLDDELRRLDASMSGAAERLAGTRRRREAREVELAALDEELSRAREALAVAEKDAAEGRALLPQHKSAVEQARSQREAAEMALRRAREELQVAEAAHREAEMQARTAEERAGAGRARVTEAEAGIADARTALEGLADLRQELEGKRTAAERVARDAETAAIWAVRWTAEAEGRALEAREAVRENDEQVASLGARERELSAQMEEAARLRNRAEVRRAEASARIAALAERAMEEWSLSLEDLGELAAIPAEEVETSRARVEELDRQMRRMGTINPRAAEEYVELAERESFLVDQMEDLRSSRQDLMKVVREVDDTIIDVFGRAYEDVEREFAGVFGRLFPGGEGKLKLTNPNDLLTSGIEVEARPPGKNVRKLSLLSGGERSLVALAFLFAIFRSLPSPFYLLDEVEAALDDVNLQRFVGLTGELEENAQVLIVTHQKRTMESADVLYGVSMGRDGVSQVVAKRMDDGSADEPHAKEDTIRV
jgi:chromosome segregation protein